MKSVIFKFVLATIFAALMISCRPTKNSESPKANSQAQPATTATPPAMSGSGRSGASENRGSAQSTSGAEAAAATTELSAATRQLLGVTLRGEGKEAGQLLAEDYKNTRPDGTIEDKAQYLAKLKPFEGFAGYMFDEFKVVSLKGDTAVVNGLVQAWNEQKKSLYSRFTWTFVKREGKWLLQSSQNAEWTDKY